MLDEIKELLKVLAENGDCVTYLEYRRNSGEHLTFSTNRLIKKIDPEEAWTKCDVCERLKECLMYGDLVDVRDEKNKRPHYKTAITYNCPKENAERSKT